MQSQNQRPSRRSAALPALSRSLLCAALFGGSAVAAEEADTQLAQTDSSKAPAAAPTPAPANPYAKFEKYRWKGINISLGAPADSLDPDIGGFRSKLADHGFGYWGYSYNPFFYNTLDNGETVGGRQVYAGQKPTFETANFLMVTYDLSRHGIPDGQIALMGTKTYTNWNPLGPNTLAIATASYYQTLFNRKLELKFGWLANNYEFVGTFVGGSLAGGAFGPQASLPYQGGMSSGLFATPGANIKLNFTSNFYNKFGIQRAISPDGTVVEEQENPGALDFDVPHAGRLLIEELGYQRPAAPHKAQTWLRAGRLWNNSDFNDFENPGERRNGNYVNYALADRQLWQKSPDSAASAYRGIYAGLSYMYAPPEMSTFSEYYEARVYAIGLFDSRPRDMISLVAVHNVFSDVRVASAQAAGLMTHDNSTAVTLSYSLRATAGVYLNMGMSYVDHPSAVVYESDTGEALNLLVNATIFF